MESTSQQPYLAKDKAAEERNIRAANEHMNFVKIRRQYKQQICIKSYHNLKKSFFHNLNDNEGSQPPKQISKLGTPKSVLLDTPQKVSSKTFDAMDRNSKTLHKPRYSGTFMMKAVEKELSTLDLSKYIQKSPKKEIPAEEPPLDPKDKKLEQSPVKK